MLPTQCTMSCKAPVTLLLSISVSSNPTLNLYVRNPVANHTPTPAAAAAAMPFEAAPFSHNLPFPSNHLSCRDDHHLNDHVVVRQLREQTDYESSAQPLILNAGGAASTAAGPCPGFDNFVKSEWECFREIIDGPPIDTSSATTTAGICGRRKRQRRRKRRECETKSDTEKEIENRRITHIVAERKRRKKMNEYLADIKSLVPASYIQRGDQASIVAGAINYVKELEHLLQSLEAEKKVVSSGGFDHQVSSPFTDFFSFPQYSTLSKETQCFWNNEEFGSSSTSTSSNSSSSSSSTDSGMSPRDDSATAAEIEVTVQERHANLKILAKKRPKQLLQLVAGFQSRRISVLHLNVATTADQMVFHSFSLKVEQGSQVGSADEIAGAANCILRKTREQGSQLG